VAPARQARRQDVALVGHSWGSSVALTMAVTQPERIRRVALYDAYVYDDQVPSFFRWAEKSGLGEILFGLYYKERFEDRAPLAYSDERWVTQARLDQIEDELDRPGTVAAALATSRKHQFGALHTALRTFTRPVLLLWGEDDEVTPLRFGQRLASELANAELEVYPRCGHIPMVEAHAASTRDLVAFLAADAAPVLSPAKGTSDDNGTRPTDGPAHGRDDAGGDGGGEPALTEAVARAVAEAAVAALAQAVAMAMTAATDAAMAAAADESTPPARAADLALSIGADLARSAPSSPRVATRPARPCSGRPPRRLPPPRARSVQPRSRSRPRRARAPRVPRAARRWTEARGRGPPRPDGSRDLCTGVGVAVKARIDWLDNVPLGGDPDLSNGSPATSSGQRPTTVVVKRAWGEALTPFGILAAGRMGAHFGLGITANGGDCDDCDKGDAADRIAFVSPMFGHLLAVAWEVASRGPFTRSRDDGHPITLDTTDSASGLNVRRAQGATRRPPSPAAPPPAAPASSTAPMSRSARRRTTSRRATSRPRRRRRCTRPTTWSRAGSPRRRPVAGCGSPAPVSASRASSPTRAPGSSSRR